MGRYVGGAVDSILTQTHAATEVIVIDDGSADETPEVLKRFSTDPRVVLIRQPNAGQTVAKNRGLREVRGDFVGFCDADDLWHPQKIERQLPHFSNPRVGVVYSDFRFIDGEGRPIPTHRPQTHSGRITGKLLADNFVHFPTVLVRREAIDAAGGFDESLTMSIDYDLWLRLSVDWEFLYLPEILVDYRIWEGQMSHRTGERLENALRLMRRFLAMHPESVTAAERHNAWAHTYVTCAIWNLHEKRPWAATGNFLRAARHRPWDARLWRSAARGALHRG
jgi:glycosyltransferase involved in cell wall biosynthesis